MIRILHASPGTPAVDIYVNDELLVQDLSYEEITDFYSILPGEYNIKVFSAGETTNPALDVDLEIAGGDNLTIAAAGVLPQVCIIPVVQTRDCPPSQQALVRLVHLSPDAPLADITLPDVTVLFAEVEYREVTDYLPIKPGVYRLQVRPHGIDTVMLDVPDVMLKENQLYTIYVLGRLEGQPDLKGLLIGDPSPHCVKKSFPRLVPDVRPYHYNHLVIKVDYR